MLIRPLLLIAILATVSKADDWPQWRGPRNDGRSAETAFPTTWTKSDNVAWRTELPGGGHASPIVFGGRLFTVAAVPETQERLLLCLDRVTGKILWKQTVVKAPAERIHRENSHASSTPACDGERVFCTFLDGKEVVVAAYDLEGKQLWLKRPGIFSSVHGFCSTPIPHKDKIIVNCDHDGDGYIVALARIDGRQLWRIERPNKTRSYCTPIVREAAGRMQMALSGSKCIASYDPDTGKELWIVDGPTDQFVASPVYSEATGLFYITGGFPDHHIMAIRPDGTGNVTDTHVVWHHHNAAGVSYVPSPIIEGNWFLLTDDRGFAHAFDAKTGDIVWNERFGRSHASIVSAAGLLYFMNDAGVCRVVKPAEKFAIVATNDLGEPAYASPALSNGQIFLRTDKALYCIGQARQARR
ncbi:MAG: PQQ-binding-like beta-propeller repeat protein [Chthoniobacteraceae bacterium]